MPSKLWYFKIKCRTVMLRWLWYLRWYRRTRRRQRLMAEETIVFGLVYGDSVPFPISGDSVRLRLPVKDSPIFPNGIPKPNRPTGEQDPRSLIRPVASDGPSPHAIRHNTRERGEWIQSKFYARLYWADGSNCVRHYMGTRRELSRVDVIAICYDRSKPKALHSAIYKWHPRVLHYATGAPICLVGYHYPTSLKGNVQPHSEQRVPTTEHVYLVSTREGEEAAHQIGAEAYIEWTEGIDEPLGVMKALMWYGYYYHLEKPF
ncbi:hypothetical protein CPB86DRAFT_878273, partial [Serendipita vermifera]